MPDAGIERFASPVPRAVRQASARADELVNQANNTTVVEPQADTPAPAAGAPPAPPMQQAPASPPAAPAPQQIDWEARYRSLQGKYDREIPTLQGQIQSLQHILSAQTAAHMQAPAAPAPAAPAGPDLAADRTEYGELVDKAMAWAEAKFAPVIEGLRHDIATLRGQTTVAANMTARQRIESSLDAWQQRRAGVDWRAQNDDQRFIDWLTQIDPFSGAPRRDQFLDAVNKGHGDRVVRFFDAFADELAAITGQQPSQSAPPQPAPAAPAQGRVSLETLAAPGRAGQGGTHQAAPAPKRQWTGAQVKDFYEQLRRGKYRGREAQAKAIEQDIFDATHEGRYRPS